MRWLPFVYQYSVMGIVFTLGIVLAVRARNLDLRTSYGKRYLFILVGGFLLMMGLQAFLQFIAPIL